MSKKYKITITKVGLFFYGLLIFILLWGYAQSTLNPNSFFGELTNSNPGMILFMVVLSVLFGVVDMLLNKIGYKTIIREINNDT